MFLFGATSMLGWSILRTGGPGVVAFANEVTVTTPPGMRGIRLDDESAMRRLFAGERPALIIHCAGVCDVEKCERSPEFAWRVNVDGTRMLLAFAPPDARIVYCSSDHVFSGDSGPYDETSPPDPISVYGRTRVAAERLVAADPRTLIVRAGLWIGPSVTGRYGHLDWLRYRHRRGLPMTVVADEVRSAVWADDAARRVWSLARSGLTGLHHVTATRAVARPELAHYLNERFAIGAQFSIERRRDRRTPHLGRVELTTRHAGPLAEPLPSVVPSHEEIGEVGSRS